MKSIFFSHSFYIVECLPFGGVGPSGIGRYHGRDSFETFTHPRAMLTTGFRGESLSSSVFFDFSSVVITSSSFLTVL